jgi:exonuclease SbcC
MIIKEVYLNNFLSHENSVVKFKGVINVIVGNNGAGKSSIIDAILFSLYREATRDVNIDDLIKKGKREAKVQSVFEVKGKEYLVERYISAGSTVSDTISLIENGKKITLARRASETTQKVKEILGGMDYKILTSTIIVGQGEIEEIFEKLPDVMKEILRIKKIEELRDSKGPIASLVKELKQKEELLEEFRKKRDEKENEIKKDEEEIEKLEKEIEEKSKELQQLKEELEKLEKEIEEKQKLRERYLQLVTEVTGLENEKRKLEEEIKGIDVLENEKRKLEEEISYENELETKKQSLQKLIDLLKNRKLIELSLTRLENERKEIEEKLKRKKELEEIEKEYQSLLEEKNKLENEEKKYHIISAQISKTKEQILKTRKEFENLDTTNLDNIQEQLTKIENELKNIQEKENELSKSYGELRGKKSELENIINNLESVKGDKCPVCGRPLSNEHKLRIKGEIEQEVDKIKAQLNQVLAGLNQIKGKKSELEKERLKIKAEYDKFARNQGKKEELKRRLEELENQLRELEEEFNLLSVSHKKYEEVSKRIEEIKTLHEEYLSYSSISDEKLESLKREIEEEKEELGKVEEEVNLLVATLKISEIVEEEIRKELAEIEKKLGELKKKKEILDDIRQKLAVKRENENRLKEISQRLEDLKKELASLNYSEEEFQILSKKAIDLKKSVDEYVSTVSELKGKFISKKEELVSKKKELEELIKKVEDIPKIENAINKLSKLREILGEDNLQSYLMNSAKNIIENNLNDVISKFDLSFSAVEINFKDKNVVSVYNSSGQKLPIRSLSGGERVSIALALRLALAKTLIKDIGFLVLDEPTVNLDEYRRKELIDIIRNAINVVPQIILVSHDPELIQAGDYIIRVEKRNDTSKVMVEENDKQDL